MAGGQKWITVLFDFGVATLEIFGGNLCLDVAYARNNLSLSLHKYNL